MRSFWNEKAEFTPESRLETHLQQEKQKQKEEEEKIKKQKCSVTLEPAKRERKFFSDDGKAYSFNDPK